ncbi:MAG: DUF2304 domain-containing protein [Acidimicrobiales bacterium]
MHLSNGELALVLILSVVWAVLGYRLSERDRLVLGRTPWGLPSLLWALFWFLSLILGLVLYLIAHGVGIRRARRSGTLFLPGAMPAAQSSAADRFPAYPRPANGGGTPPGQPHRAPLGAPAPDRQGSVASPSFPPPGWHTDPGGHFDYRWWDGSQWTSYVSKGGRPLVDTSPDQRIGPY